MRPLLRIAYRAVIRMYPASFRSEFGEEMLWIFDEECRSGRAVALFVDAARTLVLRHVRPPSERFAASGYYVEIESSLPAQRVAQSLLAILYFAVGLGVMIAPLVICILRQKARTHAAF
jgi:hypothetical protein